MKKYSRTSKFAMAALAAAQLLPLTVLAATTIYTQAETVAVGNANLLIREGSAADDVEVTATSLIVTVPAGEAFEVRTQNGRPSLQNDAGLTPCDIMKNGTNRMIINGPRTVTITPSTYNCANDDKVDPTSFVFSSPGGNVSVESEKTYQVFWQTTGKQTSSVKIRLSTDGGASYPTTIAENFFNAGYFNWEVPSMPSSTKAKLKIEAWDQGAIKGFSVSPQFMIAGTSPEPEAPTNGGGLNVDPYDYEVGEETRSAATIGIDKGLAANPSAQICTPDARIKIPGSSAVYYCAVDGKRYVFPNFKTYQTWYGDDFNGVIEISADDMAKIPLGGNVTYRPGVKMLKLTTAPDVFAVAADGTLRYVTEKSATRLYGANWNKMIDDLPDTFFVDYKIGEPVKE